MQLPELLQATDGNSAVQALRRYYNCKPFAELSPFTGASFDTWDSTGTRFDDLDRFTADDLVAVTLLSVDVPAVAAVKLLASDAHRFADLLSAVGPDRDLVKETQPWNDEWAGWQLWNELVELPGVGPTTASKLFARKRPRLRPIYDTVVERVTGSNRIWDPLRVKLVDDPDLHMRLLSLREQAGLSEAVSALRVFDVVTWMEGKYTPGADWIKV